MDPWRFVSAFTVEQAAYLWAGVDQTKSSLTSEQRNHIAARRQMLVAAIITKELPAITKHNALRTSGNHDSPLVARSDLEQFARAQKDFPPFLFDTLLPPEANDRGEDPRSKNKGGRPREHDWDAIIIEVIRVADSRDGLPDKQADLISHLLQWAEDKFGKQPAESSVKALVSKIYNNLGKGRKPSQD